MGDEPFGLLGYQAGRSMPRCEFRDSVLRRILRNSEKEQSEALAGGLYYRGLSK